MDSSIVYIAAGTAARLTDPLFLLFALCVGMAAWTRPMLWLPPVVAVAVVVVLDIMLADWWRKVGIFESQMSVGHQFAMYLTMLPGLFAAYGLGSLGRRFKKPGTDAPPATQNKWAAYKLK